LLPTKTVGYSLRILMRLRNALTVSIWSMLIPMNDITYIKIPVQQSSYETLSEQGWEPSDNSTTDNNYAAPVTKKLYRKLLTNKQQLVLKFVLEGKTRKEIASILLVSEQAVHQIIPRMRKRLNEKAGIPLKGWKRRHGGY